MSIHEPLLHDTRDELNDLRRRINTLENKLHYYPPARHVHIQGSDTVTHLFLRINTLKYIHPRDITKQLSSVDPSFRSATFAEDTYKNHYYLEGIVEYNEYVSLLKLGNDLFSYLRSLDSVTEQFTPIKLVNLNRLEDFACTMHDIHKKQMTSMHRNYVISYVPSSGILNNDIKEQQIQEKDLFKVPQYMHDRRTEYLVIFD